MPTEEDVKTAIAEHITVEERSVGSSNAKWTCNHCAITYGGSRTRQLGHLLHIKGRGVALCKNIPDQLRSELAAAVGLPDPVTGRSAPSSRSGQASTGQLVLS